MSASSDIDHWRSWIGREEAATDLLTEDLVRKFRATFDQPLGDLRPGEVAPRLIHFCLSQPAAMTGSLGEDGHPQRGGFLPPVGLPRRMWAGGSLMFHDDLRIGDTVRRVSRIADVTLKEGQTGTLCFVTVAHEIEVIGRPIISETQDIVYRDAESGQPKPRTPPAMAPAGAYRRTITPSPTLLFRYSALTFNGHRIHYDHPYATQVEHYPGLVVHSPMQATMLLHYATEIHGAPPTRFTFRSLSPVFDNEAFHLNAEAEGDTLKLWTAREAGPPAMAARAEW